MKRSSIKYFVYPITITTSAHVANQTREGLPPIKISGDTSEFGYSNKHGHRSAIRIVSETLRLGLKDVRWFVMGDDDTVFITDNLIRVLRKYDHTQYYYIGSLSESHLQNIFFSYGMAYGGGGFAISYPLAEALSKMQDRCIQRYPGLYGSDDRMQACMAELGVPLTKELGFHQIYGYRMSLWAEHLGLVEECFDQPESLECVQRVRSLGEQNWSQYAAEEVTEMKGHLLKYPVEVGPTGTVGSLPECDTFPDIGGKILGSLGDLMKLKSLSISSSGRSISLRGAIITT